MPEPTIDEMLEFMNHMSFLRGNNAEIAKAVRAILEQHREIEYPLVTEAVRQHRNQLKAIRAFVEQVEKRIAETITDWNSANGLLLYARLMREELAAMEKEAE